MSGYAGITSGSSVAVSGFPVVGYAGLSVGACVISGMSGSATSGGGVPAAGSGDDVDAYSGPVVVDGYSGADGCAVLGSSG